jgi:very-short-patch-repair endonuclease
MFEGADPLVFELAKDLRRNMTEAETVLWMHLRAGVHGLKVHRQHPVGVYEILNDVKNVLEIIKTKVEVLIQNNIVNQNRSPL